MLSPLRATAPPQAGADQHHAAHDREPTGPGGNRALLFNGRLEVALPHDAAVRTVADTLEHHVDAQADEYESSNQLGQFHAQVLPRHRGATMLPRVAIVSFP
jgi:hypothetical protein